MHHTKFCSRCGAPLYGDICPQCSTVGQPVANKAPRDGIAVRLITETAAAIVLGLGVSLMLSHHYSGKRNFANLAAARILHPDRPIARIDQLKGSGRIYLVQMGSHKLPYSLDQFADWLKSKYHLDVEVLPPSGLDHSAWDPSRNQYVAELLYGQLKREHPDLAADPKAYLYGFTDADMYSVHYFWESTFTQRDHDRAAVISAAHMQDTAEQSRVSDKAANEHLQQRLRRILLKDVAVQYWQLPQNNDSSSLLHWTIDPNLLADDIYASDLDPEHMSWGRSEGEPCVFLRYSSSLGIQLMPGRAIRYCSDFEDSTPDPSEETFQLSLRYGVMVDRHTDFYLQDSIPLQLERVTRDGWKGPMMGFGMSGTHNYDNFLQSNDMVVIDVVNDDGGRYHLKRTPNLPLPLSFLKYVDTDFSGKMFELSWHSSPFEHFDLKKYDGSAKTYLPCDNRVICYQIGYRNAEGQELVFQRDERRRLTRLASPGKQWINFSYGPASSILEASDSSGRTVRYGYDDRNRLVSVSYPSGEVHSYEYDDQQHLLTFGVAPSAKSAPRVILRNTYENGRLATQTLADGSVYKYSYEDSRGAIRTAYVTTPGGSVFEVRLQDDGSTIWERSSTPGYRMPTQTADSVTTEWARP